MAARTVEILTNDNVCLSSGLFDDGRVVQSTVDELRIGVLGLNLLAPILISDEECVLIVRVLLLKNVEGVTTDVSLLKVPVSLSKPQIEQCVSARLTGDSGPGIGQQFRISTCWENWGLQEDLGCHVFLWTGASLQCVVHLFWLRWKTLTVIDCREFRNKLFATTKARRICTWKDICNDEILSTV